MSSGGPGLNTLFHGVSVVLNIMGEGCEWVESMGSVIYDVVRLHYPGPAGGTEVIMTNCRGKAPGYTTNVGNYQ